MKSHVGQAAWTIGSMGGHIFPDRISKSTESVKHTWRYESRHTWRSWDHQIDYHVSIVRKLSAIQLTLYLPEKCRLTYNETINSASNLISRSTGNSSRSYRKLNGNAVALTWHFLGFWLQCWYAHGRYWWQLHKYMCIPIDLVFSWYILRPYCVSPLIWLFLPTSPQLPATCPSSPWTSSSIPIYSDEAPYLQTCPQIHLKPISKFGS